ncbi:MAG: response regulator [Halodesulfurarchaeum sp.]
MWGAGTDTRILHVDPEAKVREAVERQLETLDEGFEVDSVGTAEAAWDRLKEGIVDAIVLGHQPPELDGLELLQRLRDRGWVLPVIIFTGDGSEKTAGLALSAGATAYLPRDGSEDPGDELGATVSSALEEGKARERRERAMSAIDSAQEAVGVIDDQHRLVYVNDRYATVYGYEPAELVDQPWEGLYSEAAWERMTAEIIPTAHAEGGWRGRTTGRRANGETFAVEHTIATTDRGEFFVPSGRPAVGAVSCRTSTGCDPRSRPRRSGLRSRISSSRTTRSSMRTIGSWN